MQNLGGLSGSGGAADVLGVSDDVNSSTLLKKKNLITQELIHVDVPSVGSPFKRAANVAFDMNESCEFLVSAS